MTKAFKKMALPKSTSKALWEKNPDCQGYDVREDHVALVELLGKVKGPIGRRFSFVFSSMVCTTGALWKMFCHTCKPRRLKQRGW